ncbi:hypothetical protein DERP_002265 [Dermatophagoides pteronyssinus]|uniref:Uncharacterized protein n=1 Tax=Dermatophagoides pteronyssinus TaxID=6956 RepID=A0ABQ8JHW3_DERPT|nr:hypothetical protein DERP_002265 [Dermatophagoides pteronyssinus]
MFSNETLCMWTYIYEATEPIPILMIMAMYSLMCACMTADTLTMRRFYGIINESGQEIFVFN